MPEEQNFASNSLDNFDFAGGFNNFNALPPSATPMPMAPPSAFQSTVQSNMPIHSTPSTRSASFMSQSSSQGNALNAPQTPTQAGYAYDGAYSSQTSPQDPWNNVGNAVVTAPTPARREMNDFDVSFLNMNENGSHGFDDDIFGTMAEALSGQA